MSENPTKADATRAVTAGRHPFAHHGAVNPPVYHASTILFPTLDALEDYANQSVQYGRRGTPGTFAFEEAICELEGGARTLITPSGLSACTLALFACVKQGSHVLVTDSVYEPTRNFCNRFLKRFGVETTYYDPRIGGAITNLIRPETTAIVTEAPGSLTFEMQDIPAIAAAAKASGDALVICDNTWATPLLFKPLDHGVDLSVQAATKYIVGHSDAMLGAVTANDRAATALVEAHRLIGLCAGPDDIYLGLRGLRTMAVRLERHWQTGVRLAEWLAARPEVDRVLHPALPGDPGHGLWRRDFKGASGLFGCVLTHGTRAQMAAFLDGLELFGMGYSWGGYESLIVPSDPSHARTATKWHANGPALRIHAGLEDAQDLIADLDAGFRRFNDAA